MTCVFDVGVSVANLTEIQAKSCEISNRFFLCDKSGDCFLVLLETYSVLEAAVKASIILKLSPNSSGCFHEVQPCLKALTGGQTPGSFLQQLQMTADALRMRKPAT